MKTQKQADFELVLSWLKYREIYCYQHAGKYRFSRDADSDYFACHDWYTASSLESALAYAYGAVDGFNHAALGVGRLSLNELEERLGAK